MSSQYYVSPPCNLHKCIRWRFNVIQRPAVLFQTHTLFDFGRREDETLLAEILTPISKRSGSAPSDSTFNCSPVQEKTEKQTAAV
ncbi:hypothetical protein QQF64_015727 [Cirrhinus molitorella]|uniref:Uncharacterized protein n=1 Tax=Cirrhinus molitorella TaxID=172907 RepID=A0ABR3NWG3_9TELE